MTAEGPTRTFLVSFGYFHSQNALFEHSDDEKQTRHVLRQLYSNMVCYRAEASRSSFTEFFSCIHKL